MSDLLSKLEELNKADSRANNNIIETTKVRGKQVNSCMDEADEKEQYRNSIPSIGKWLLTLLLLLIPGVNLIMLLIWAIGKGNRARKNLSISLLIMLAIFVTIIGAVYYFVGIQKLYDVVKNLYNNSIFYDYLKNIKIG